MIANNLIKASVEAAASQKIMIINGSAEVLELLEIVENSGQFSVVFIESKERAYSKIKQVQPNLVILCVDIDDIEGFKILSMLKLDAATKDIPVLTSYTTRSDSEGDGDSDDVEHVTKLGISSIYTPLPMN